MSGHFGSCGDCRYSAAVEGVYTCCRYAPKPQVVQIEELVGYAAEWPVVDVDDWCGEFMAR